MLISKKHLQVFTSDSDVFSNTRSNNWNLIRLIAAVGVIYGHSTLLTPGGRQTDFFAVNVARGITYSGQMAVIIFFFLSGALVTKSLVTSKSPLHFAAKRVFRIYPGLIVCTAISAFILPIIFGNGVKIQDSFKYFKENALGISNSYYIPGLFSEAKSQAINGSLWTIPNEVRLYFLLFLLFFISQKLSKQSLIGLNFIFLWFLIYAPSEVPLVGANMQTRGNPIWVINSIFFTLGSLAFLTGLGKLKGYCYGITSASMYLLWTYFPSRHLIFFISLVFGAMFLSKLKVLNSINLKSDYSYGIYLYGWPAAQIVNLQLPWTNSDNGFLLSLLLAAFFAACSWHFIEKRGIALVRRHLK